MFPVYVCLTRMRVSGLLDVSAAGCAPHVCALYVCLMCFLICFPYTCACLRTLGCQRGKNETYVCLTHIRMPCTYNETYACLTRIRMYSAMRVSGLWDVSAQERDIRMPYAYTYALHVCLTRMPYSYALHYACFRTLGCQRGKNETS
jgi:hypothetical protein